MKNAAQKQISV